MPDARRFLRHFVLTTLAAGLAGCLAKPDYQRPAIELPQAWKQSAPPAVLDGRWWTLYGDPALDALVEEALKSNTDLAVAVARVDEARALVKDAEAALYPTVDLTGVRRRSLSSGATGLLPPGIPRELNDTRIALNVSYEIDLWGRLSTTAQAARADLLGTEAARETVRIALAADVVKAWFGLRSLDNQVEATRRTLKLREEALGLQKKRFEHGLISEFEYRQLEAEAAAVRAQLPPLERDREAQDAALAVLLGRSPKAILENSVARNSTDEPKVLPAVVPSGLPSELLLRRPDLLEAEQRLIAANARVAVARTALFPSISLTGFLGTEAAAMRDLFSGPAGIWSLAAAIAQPIFSAGRLQAQTEAARARERQLLARYQGTIQNAFREVRSALSAQTRARESFEAEDQRAVSLRSALKLARLRYENGMASQLDVIDAERNLLAAEVARHEALRAQRAAVADLYKALGG
ncbi:MAG TPA: efflux transporter outer membrane subunit [Burkholderiales bacterium]|jgi:multidrug efflux system outer membrane protein|nr:efflux transporter outer membrane subunit [Burkholderiales bacterium]